ncbi:Putative diguanylate cyclase/phosphodiesterase [Bradyrhizobium sp. ORS 285]|nr:putative diguanylate cyclase/phosphodiesterase [Bradyrhizobium sp. ORS 285]SMX61048.1 Putative diguanylate cyclase/phosphodiesterase [Bradyrhizobium sp. ORS 285]
MSVGDNLLRTFSEHLRDVARNTDTVGRYSENIFLVIAEIGGDPVVLKNLLARLLHTLSFRLETKATSIAISVRVGSVLCHEVHRDGVVTSADLVAAAIAELSSEVSRAREAEATDGSSAAAASMAAVTDAQNAGTGLRTVDRRKEPRKRVLKRGQIVSASLGVVVDCTVRNVSARGAALRIDAPFAVPTEFDLVIPGDGTRRCVRLRWQVGTDLGVDYVDR